MEGADGTTQSWELKTVLGRGLWVAAHASPPFSKVEIGDTWISVKPWRDKIPFTQITAVTYTTNFWPKETGWIAVEEVKGGFLRPSFLAGDKTRDEIFACLRAKGVKCG